MTTNAPVSQDLGRAARRIATATALCGLIAGCDGGSSSGSGSAAADVGTATNAAPIASPTLQFDPAQPTDLGSIRPLRAISFAAPAGAGGAPTLELLYVSQGDGSSYRQVARRMSTGEDFSVLVPPFALDGPALVDIYADPDGVSSHLGVLTVESLPRLAESDNAGRYAELAMNALLFDLRDTYEILALTRPDGAGAQAHDRWREILGTAIERFQQTMFYTHDAAVFNSPVRNPDSGAVLLDGEDFHLVDRIVLTIADRLTNEGILFDFAGANAGFGSAEELERSFTLFAGAVGQFVGDLDGIDVIGSLALRPGSADVEDELSAPLALFEAALMPVILNNAATRDGGFGVPTPEAAAMLDFASARLVESAAAAGPEQFVLRNAVSALRQASKALTALVAEGTVSP